MNIHSCIQSLVHGLWLLSVTRQIESRFYSNSEANASELLENPGDQMCLWYHIYSDITDVGTVLNLQPHSSVKGCGWIPNF